ncbi:MAG: phage holin family protein [Chloroflexota bacterium]
MTKFIIRWAINAVGLFAAVWLVPGIDHAIERNAAGSAAWMSLIWLALIFGLLNALLRPLLKLLTCPLIVLTLGLFTLVINTVMLMLTSWVGNYFDLGLTVDGFWPAFLGAVIISVVSIILSLILRDDRRGKK